MSVGRPTVIAVECGVYDLPQCDKAFLAAPSLPVMEAALAPFPPPRQPVDAAWIMTDRHDRHFDADDERMRRLLADFAGACWVQWQNWEAAIAQNRRRDEIFTTLIHELRSPLAAITAAACVIERTAGLAAVGGQPAIEVVKRQSWVLSRIVDDLSDLSRIGRDKLQLRLEWLEIHPIIADAVLAAQPRITSRRQELRMSLLPCEEIRCHVDAVRLAQILINLLDNASKYTPDGGHIELVVVCRSRTVDLIIRDDGVGIPPDKLREVFEPFTQLRSPDARPSEGLGVGLALADKLATMLNGSLRAASAGPGKGAEFTVSLPRDTSSHRSAGDDGCDGARYLRPMAGASRHDERSSAPPRTSRETLA